MEQFEPNDPGNCQGEITAVRVTQDGDTKLVVDPSKDCTIHVEWEMFGTYAPGVVVGGVSQWRVDAYAESIGSGWERARIGREQPDTHPSIACTVHGGELNCRRWEAAVTVNANMLREARDDGTGWESGLYKLAVAVFLNSEVTGQADVIGFHEGPMIQAEIPA